MGMKGKVRGRVPSWLACLLGTLYLAGTFVLPVTSSAQINSPALNSGQYLTPVEAPCIPWELGNSTGTAEALVVGGSTTTVTAFSNYQGSKATITAPGYVNWIMMSTGTAGSFVVLRDTAALATGNVGGDSVGNNLLGNIMFSSATANGAFGNLMTMINFIPPVRFGRGLTMQATGITGNQTAVVCIRGYGQQYP